eukprot:TRINITY_DN43788_c0_g1_i2.p1 TRINITY_DN43788_c0_g1~~TRINITY_DN43788_c0_g1_i2.p1  ORF type:complete len:583 (-),score=170.92 TRINITY_DN43788_c0_g1_i2:833-2581(-)
MASALGGSAGQQRWVKAAKGAAGAVAIAGLAGYQLDEGFRRVVQFNYNVLPIALHYKAVQLYSRGRETEAASSQAFGRLHTRYAPVSLDIVLQQRGFYVKTAQFLSQYPEVIPDEYVEAFKILRDDAPAMPFCQVKSIVEEDLGLPLDKVFSAFEERPLGAASIGQVHAARLVDGTEVVVKVQYPGAQRLFYIDIDMSIRLSQLLAPYYVNILEQLQKKFLDEFDYRREARLQREAFKNQRPGAVTKVPEPYDEQHRLCKSLFGRGLISKNVFVMERLYGKPVDKWAAEQLLRLAVREGKSVEEVTRQLRAMKPEDIEKHVPSKAAIRAYSAVVGMQDTIRNVAAFGYNWTLGWLGAPIHYAWSPRPVNVHQVVSELFQVQAKCIFEDGFVNGDPHAGNVLLLDDGRLGLIDWGQVATLTPEERVAFAKAIIAVADRDEVLIAKMAWEIGVDTKHRNDWVAMKLATFWLGSFGEDVVGELGGATCFEDNLGRIDQLTGTPDVYFCVVRCLMMTRGVAALLGFPACDSAKQMRSSAEACLRAVGEKLETVPGRRLPKPNLEALLGSAFAAPSAAATAAPAAAA